MSDEKMSLEEVFDKLDSLLMEMDRPDIALEASFAKFKEGIDLIAKANSSIEKIEQELTVLEEDV